MNTITVRTAAPYDIVIGRGLLAQAGARLRALFPRAGKIAVITDDIVGGLYAAPLAGSLRQSGFEAVQFTFPNGEPSKCQETLNEIYAFLSHSQITRSDAIAALGGGVTGDLAGFAAASWLRGIPFAQIPTTFLAAIDSSVGGKTGVNIPAGKNLVGAFWQPRCVLCDVGTLSTLPEAAFCDGVAEAIKYGALFDRDLFTLLADGRAAARLDEIISRCVDLKRRVVEEDERDAGQRQLLNFGHTLGHAIERQSHFSVTHGRAVGMGMVEITLRSEALGLTAPGCARDIAAALASYGMPTRFDGGLRPLIPALYGDKKRRGDRLDLVLLNQIGDARLHSIPLEDAAPFFAPA